ncbi:uncharacterized protein B0H64DRAFT_376936 [Chaetomium fimeti]|uniref:Zn(2)-C6 fungal-type domain-containing protein n=1 Tax=Chaetomium fimeti TaxID=1854472 RepID=A0AAE0H9X7_9PEZI|nr:hypothetical protein B0H64DRAFT_376936 [Chaetomium fimeti]
MSSATMEPQLPTILCIHGHGTNVAILRLQASRIVHALSDKFRFVFVDAPFTSLPGPGVVPVFSDFKPFLRWHCDENTVHKFDITPEELEEERRRARELLAGVPGKEAGAKSAPRPLCHHDMRHISRVAHRTPETLLRSHDPWAAEGRRLIETYFEPTLAKTVKFSGGHQVPAGRIEVAQIAAIRKRLPKFWLRAPNMPDDQRLFSRTHQHASAQHTMHRPQSESVREGKLRAACDRCHELKNRCVRIGGADSRCDRCERLDIDCVYRYSSRMGRPKGQKKTSVTEARQFSETGRQQTSSPLGIQPTDVDWGVDFFGRHITGIHSSLFPRSYPSPQAVQQVDDGISSPTPGVNAPSPNSTRPNEVTTTLADRLLELQAQLHRHLAAADGQMGSDNVQDGLEVAKTFLAVLQASFASSQNDMASTEPLGFPSADQLHAMTTNWPSVSGHNFACQNRNSIPDDNDPMSAMDEDPTTETPCAVSFVTAQQALTCYSYVLLLLDRVVSGVTSPVRCAAPTNANTSAAPKLRSPSQESPTVLRLGLFSLDSQPALNTEIVLHLRLQIQKLASKCNELGGGGGLGQTRSPGTAAAAVGNSDEEAFGRKGTSPAPIAAIVHAVSSLIVERESSLIDRLSSLTAGTAWE